MTPRLNEGALAPRHDEASFGDVVVDGAIPDQLIGSLVRNGPNPFSGRFHGEGMLEWWTGPAMLHAIDFEPGGRVGYRNRWVRTAAHEAAHDVPVSRRSGVGQNVNVNVVSFADQRLALGEGSIPAVFDAQLETVGPASFARHLPGGMTAHPKLDPVTGELVWFHTGFEPPFLTHGVLGPEGGLRHSATIEMSGPVMMHDFAITERCSVFFDLSVGYDLDLLAAGVAIPIRWFDARPSRLGVLPRFGDDCRWFEVEPCFVQHVVNAHEVGSHVIVDVVRYPRFLVFDLDTVDFVPNPLGQLWRYDIDLETGVVAEGALDDRPIELPRIDDRIVGRRHRRVYAVEQPTDAEMRGVLSYDLDTGHCTRHVVPPGDQNSEPVFVADSSSDRVDRGWLLVCVYRASTDTSDVIVLDASDVAAPPLAIVRLPCRIPAGFHGAWFGASTTARAAGVS